MGGDLIFRVLFTISIVVSFSFAQKLSFPAEKPALLVEFPKSWSIEIDQEAEAGITAFSDDEEVEIDLWMLEQKKVNKNAIKALNSAIEEIDDIIVNVVKKFKVIEQGEGEVDGIKYLFVDGVGIDRENGEKIQVYVELFTPNEENVFVMLYWASKEAEAKHLKEINKIFDSIQKIR